MNKKLKKVKFLLLATLFMIVALLACYPSNGTDSNGSNTPGTSTPTPTPPIVATGISFPQRHVYVDKHDSVQLTPTFYPEGAIPLQLVWESSNEEVADFFNSAPSTIADLFTVEYGWTLLTGTSLCGELSVEIEMSVMPEGWVLTFEDNFLGDELDRNNWTPQTGIGQWCQNNNWNFGLTGWGNSEIMYYRNENITVQDNFMRITGRRERVAPDAEIQPFLGPASNPQVATHSRDFTSARMRSRGHFSQRWGRFEAKMRMCAVPSLWPAFWLMPEPLDEHRPHIDPGGGSGRQEVTGAFGGWPHSGEIDIMEWRGRVPHTHTSAMHFGLQPPGTAHTYIHSSVPFGGIEDTFEEWVTFGVDWYQDRMEFWVNHEVFWAVHARGSAWASANGVTFPTSPDLRPAPARPAIPATPACPDGTHPARPAVPAHSGMVVSTRGWRSHAGRYNTALNPAHANASMASDYAPFDQPFHMIINMAMGGWFDGGGGMPADFQEAFLDVYWVRVWQKGNVECPNLENPINPRG
ncbi:MAG: glycoside hydrolase family 16 protein [Firmicutes bacterium]|nr:glycoside hydrolase family 16 protein [Bacillota bacterium]